MLKGGNMTMHNTKKLAVFFDGTWNSADQHAKDGQPCPTNVSRLFEATLPKDEHNHPQIVHYVQGVGTRTGERVSGGGFGYGISDNIRDGYKFLVSNYEQGDEIYIFGFSRGAYTARSLAGMIRNVGILKREKLYLLNEAFRGYRDKSKEWHPNGPRAQAFRREHTWESETIRFLGVFDTVGALGAPFGIALGWLVDKLFHCSFHSTQLSSIIQSAYHALAVDERRLPFQPTPMSPNTRHDAANFEEKWFPGAHANVGGGYAATGLADEALSWMAGKATLHGLHLNLEKITNPPWSPNIQEPPQNSQTLTYRVASVLFVKMPGYLGLVPEKYKAALPYLQWNGDYIRPIPGESNLHDSVLEKIDTCPDYQPPNVR
jgi:uncharacterized protein (DUF2235 family)